MIGHFNDVFESSRKTGFSDLFSDGKLAEISGDFESTAPFVLFTCGVLSKPLFGAGQLQPDKSGVKIPLFAIAVLVLLACRG